MAAGGSNFGHGRALFCSCLGLKVDSKMRNFIHVFEMFWNIFTLKGHPLLIFGLCLVTMTQCNWVQNSSHWHLSSWNKIYLSHIVLLIFLQTNITSRMWPSWDNVDWTTYTWRPPLHIWPSRWANINNQSSSWLAALRPDRSTCSWTNKNHNNKQRAYVDRCPCGRDVWSQLITSYFVDWQWHKPKFISE